MKVTVLTSPNKSHTMCLYGNKVFNLENLVSWYFGFLDHVKKKQYLKGKLHSPILHVSLNNFFFLSLPVLDLPTWELHTHQKPTTTCALPETWACFCRQPWDILFLPAAQSKHVPLIADRYYSTGLADTGDPPQVTRTQTRFSPLHKHHLVNIELPGLLHHRPTEC